MKRVSQLLSESFIKADGDGGFVFDYAGERFKDDSKQEAEKRLKELKVENAHPLEHGEKVFYKGEACTFRGKDKAGVALIEFDSKRNVFHKAEERNLRRKK